MARRPKPWFWKARKAWFVTIEGQRHYLADDEEAAVKRFYRLMSEPQKRTVRSDALVYIIDQFLEWCSRHRAPDTYEWYRYRLERFARRFPDLEVADLRPHHVETWVSEYDFSVTSRRNYLRSIKRCIAWAKKQGYLDSDPIAQLEVPSAEHREVLITVEQYEAFCKYIRNDEFRDLVTVTWETGCRPQESLRVEARHVDQQHQRWLFPRSESKTKRLTRVIYLTDEAMKITKRRLLRYPSGPIFRNLNGKPWKTEAVNCAFQSVRQRMGQDEMKRRGITISDADIKQFAKSLKPTRTSRGEEFRKTESELRMEAKRKLTFKKATELAPPLSLYALRHSWATRALQRGMDPLTVAILMGHRDPSMLSRVYQHLSLDPEHMLQQAKRATG